MIYQGHSGIIERKFEDPGACVNRPGAWPKLTRSSDLLNASAAQRLAVSG